MSISIEINSHQTRFTDARNADAPEIVVLAFGTALIADKYFKHTPPTAGELEAAIEQVEDVLMPEIPKLRDHEALITSDLESANLLAFSGLSDGATTLDLNTVERQFNRLVNVAQGRPAASEGMPTHPEFAANLLILREVMHHTGFVSVTVRL